MNWKNIILGTVFLVLGAVNLAGEIKRLRACSEETTATVIDVKRSRTGKRSRSYTPVMEFYVDGRAYVGDGNMLGSSFRRRFKVGDTMEILYDPEDPSLFRPKGKPGMFITSVLMIVFAAAMVWMGIKG